MPTVEDVQLAAQPKADVIQCFNCESDTLEFSISARHLGTTDLFLFIIRNICWSTFKLRNPCHLTSCTLWKESQDSASLSLLFPVWYNPPNIHAVVPWQLCRAQIEVEACLASSLCEPSGPNPSVISTQKIAETIFVFKKEIQENFSFVKLTSEKPSHHLKLLCDRFNSKQATRQCMFAFCWTRSCLHSFCNVAEKKNSTKKALYQTKPVGAGILMTSFHVQVVSPELCFHSQHQVTCFNMRPWIQNCRVNDFQIRWTENVFCAPNLISQPQHWCLRSQRTDDGTIFHTRDSLASRKTSEITNCNNAGIGSYHPPFRSRTGRWSPRSSATAKEILLFSDRRAPCTLRRDRQNATAPANTVKTNLWKKILPWWKSGALVMNCRVIQHSWRTFQSQNTKKNPRKIVTNFAHPNSLLQSQVACWILITAQGRSNKPPFNGTLLTSVKNSQEDTIDGFFCLDEDECSFTRWTGWRRQRRTNPPQGSSRNTAVLSLH